MDNELPELFMTGIEGMQVIVIEEVAKRTVADVVHQRSDSEELFDVIGGWYVGDGFF